ncbi:MAG: amidohydrolase family protein [Chloroflexi bacterium]|nr:amidohydrolase family protein [Chloroflexota bacterium]
MPESAAPAPFLPPHGPLPDPGLRTPGPDERGARVLLRGGQVVDVRAGQIRQNADVLVEGGWIEQVGTGLSDAGARVVDVSGRYLLPGLIDLHVHPGMMVGLRMDPNGMTPERIRHDLAVWLRYGVTTVQAMGTDRPFSFEIQREQRKGALIGARLFSVGHGFGLAGGVPPFQIDPPGVVRETEPGAIGVVMKRLADYGASGVKLWYDDWYGQFPKMAPEVARTIVQAAHRARLTAYAHVYTVDDASLLVGFGLDALAHMPRDREVDEFLVDRMLSRGAAAVPTLTIPDTNAILEERPAFVDDPLFGKFLPPGSVEYLKDDRFIATIRAKPEYSALRPDLDRALHNTAVLASAGIAVGFGTDAGVSNRVIGFSEHRELELLVQAGIRPADALRMATLTSARILGQDSLGEIAPRKRADLLVLQANPLEDVRHTRSIESVWSEGVQAAGPLEQ